LPFQKIEKRNGWTERFRQWFAFLLENRPVTPLPSSLAGVDATLFTDASLDGVGAVLVIGGNVFHFGRRWTAEELADNRQRTHDGDVQASIAALELLAAEVGLRHFADQIANRRLHLVSDSTTGLGALRKGNSKSELLNDRVAGVKAAFAVAKPTAAVTTYIV